MRPLLACLVLLFSTSVWAQSLVARDAGSALAPDGVTTARAVALDLDALSLAAEARTPVALDLFDARLVATPDRVQRRGADRYTVSGAVNGGGRMLLTVERGVVYGRIVTPRRELVIAPGAGGHVAYTPAPDIETDDAIPAPRTEARTRGGADLLFPDELHIALFYTDPVAAILGDGLDAYLQGTVDVLRDILANSNVPLGVRVVYQDRIDYTESGLMRTDIFAFQDPTDGQMDEVAGIRDETSADLVALITDAGTDACGIAFLADPPDPSFEAAAYSVTRQSCQFGYVFAHEVGHNSGLTHDRTVVPNPTLIDYAYGFVNLDSATTVQPGFRTTLSYSRQCRDSGLECPRIPYYSNPEELWDGQPMGAADSSDNARVLRETMSITTGYRTPVLVASFDGTTAGADAWARPVCTDASDLNTCTVSADAVPLATRAIRASGDGLYYVRTATDADGVLLLYDGTYDPATPLVGLIGYAEADPAAPASRRLMLSARLGAGDTYTLVTTGQTATDAGAFATDVFGPGASQIAVGAETPVADTGGLALGQAVPNPSRGTVSIPISVARTQAVEVAVFDALGRRVAVLHSGVLPAGAVHTVQVQDVPPGVYIVRASTAETTVTQRITRL